MFIFYWKTSLEFVDNGRKLSGNIPLQEMQTTGSILGVQNLLSLTQECRVQVFVWRSPLEKRAFVTQSLILYLSHRKREEGRWRKKRRRWNRSRSGLCSGSLGHFNVGDPKFIKSWAINTSRSLQTVGNFPERCPWEATRAGSGWGRTCQGVGQRSPVFPLKNNRNVTVWEAHVQVLLPAEGSARRSWIRFSF